ncbi:uncharacterized protein LOC119447648 [Dermacentor silvarum]|uniref:uncharacterized protein LOC119447648 n=1 Tax=Dermacentor silvarum TaxID=543639 RepID=UPI0018970242|nr:uncharacterized protein LOC119447648 [Dermacentor silvarum]
MDANEDFASSDPGASGILRSRNTTAAYTACGRLLRSRPAHTPSAIAKRVRNARTTTSGRGRAPPRRLLTPTPEELSPAIQQGSRQPSATENTVPSPPSETISSVSLSAPAVQKEPPVVRFYFVSPIATGQLAASTLPATPQFPPTAPADCDENEARSDESHETSPVCSTSSASSSSGSSFYEQTTPQTTPQPSPSAVSTESSSQTDSDETTSSSHSDETASPQAPATRTGFTPTPAVGSPDNSRSAPPNAAFAIASAAETDVTAPTHQQAAVSPPATGLAREPLSTRESVSPTRHPCQTLATSSANGCAAPPANTQENTASPPAAHDSQCTPSVPSTPRRSFSPTPSRLPCLPQSATDRTAPPVNGEETHDLARAAPLVRPCPCA